MIRISRVCSNNFLALIPSLLSVLSPQRAVHGFSISQSGVNQLLPAKNLSQFSTPALHSTKKDMSSPRPRRSSRNKTATPKRKKDEDQEPADPALTSTSVTESVSSSSSAAEESKKEEPTPKRKKVASKKENNKTKKETISKSPKKAKVEPQRITEREKIEKLWNGNDGSHTFKILSWNVAGLRAILRKDPEALPSLATKYDIDVICLQETKLQEIHVNDPKLKIKGFLLEDENYESHFSCSEVKKGYSGTAVFIKKRGTEKKVKKQATLNFSKKNNTSEPKSTEALGIDSDLLKPVDISFGLGKDEHDGEGRVITVDFPLFSLTNLYVPNSGQKLDRLSYRTEQWDEDLLSKMKEKERTKPVIWLGDLNVAHTNLDVWNDGAKHLAKQAGTTQEERDSFQRQLDANDGAFVDAFRHLHPTAKGHYSYWSQRAGNRAPNKGLRLDYFICSRSLMEDDQEKQVIVRDSYMLPEQFGSDHCPVVLELEIKE